MCVTWLERRGVPLSSRRWTRIADGGSVVWSSALPTKTLSWKNGLVFPCIDTLKSFYEDKLELSGPMNGNRNRLHWKWIGALYWSMSLVCLWIIGKFYLRQKVVEKCEE